MEFVNPSLVISHPASMESLNPFFESPPPKQAETDYHVLPRIPEIPEKESLLEKIGAIAWRVLKFPFTFLFYQMGKFIFSCDPGRYVDSVELSSAAQKLY